MHTPNESEEEILAFTELKQKIVKLMLEFTESYTGIDNPKNLYPRTPYILVDVLTACLDEAQSQCGNYYPFTKMQIDHILQSNW